MPTLTAHVPGTPSWFDLMTSDAEAGRAFYGALFGWTWDVSGPEMGHYGIARREGAVAAGLGAIPPGNPMPPAWTVYFAVESADATAEAITAAGGVVMMPPMDVGPEGRMAIAQDPTGAVFGIWQPGNHKGAEVVHAPGAMDWCEVNTRDSERARTFYAQVFGLESRLLDAPMPTTYHTLHHAALPGDGAAGGVLQMTDAWGELPPHWMVYFAVESADATAQQVATLGGTCLHGPFDTPYGRIAVLQDPQGAVFSVNASIRG